MSLATGIAPAALMDADPHMLATIAELLAQRVEAIRGH